MINSFIAPFYNSTGETIFIKLIEVSIFPHLFNFLLGVIMYYFWDTIKKYVENRAVIWVSVYIAYIIVFEYILRLYGPSYYPNIFGLISTMLLSMAIISLAFSNKSLAEKILKNKDISYGVYIYHGPILNIFVSLGIKTKILSPPPPHAQEYVPDIFGIGILLLIVAITVFLACVSWIFIEKKALSFKGKL
jgi:peptidoglycan/LPS O-acetylase OafA/YrhL